MISRLNQIWWEQIPIRLAKLSQTLAVLMADGFYLSAWPKVGALSPIVAFLIGLGAGWLHPEVTYTYTLSIAMILMAIGNFGAGLGSISCLGYSLGDFFLFSHSSTESSFLGFLQLRLPLLISYILLASLMVSIPTISRGLRQLTIPNLDRKFPQLSKPQQNIMIAIAGITQAVFQGFFVYAWTQAVPILIRPIFTWRGRGIDVAAIQPLQERGNILVIVGTILGLMRVFWEYQAHNQDSIQKLRIKLLQEISQTKDFFSSLPVSSFIFFKSIFLTFMLSGMLSSYLEASIFFLSLAATFAIREGLLLSMRGWVNFISKIPAIARIVIAAIFNSYLALKIIESFWNEKLPSIFFPVVVSTVLGILIFGLLFPVSTATEVPGGKGQTR